MKHSRLLAAVLGCLAILAGGLPAVALAWAPSTAPSTERMAVAEPCTHCPDCDGTPCPSAAACIVACVGVPPTLGVANFVLATTVACSSAWPGHVTTLHGLSPPPDPFPPRV